MRSSFLSLIIATLFTVTLAGTARAEIFTAYLTPVQEVPPVASPNAQGYARIIINESTGAVTFTVVFTGFSSTQTASHIHAPAPIGATAGVAVNLGAVGGTAGTITGSTTITPTQLAQLRQGLGYVNVHSTNFPGGEIRGQLQKTRVIDYDGDGRTDYSVLRFPDIDPPAVAAIDWWNFNSYVGSQTYNGFGDANRDFPAPGDYDGDGRTDIAIFRSGAVATYWIVRSTTNTLQVIEWGTTGDQTIQRDYDGDGRTDPAVFRFGALATDPTTWLIRNSSNGTARIEQFGLSGNGTTSSDFAVPGDYDGDGKFDLAVYRFGQAPANNWIVKRSSDGVVTYQPFGNFNTDYILPGDYDGDGKYDYAAARTGSTSTSPMTWWYIRSSSGSTHTQVFGRSSDLPAQGDYDGDGRTDIAIYRPGATALAQSSYWVSRSFDLGAHQTIWGLGADFSVNTYDIR